MMVTNLNILDFSSDGPLPYSLRQRFTGWHSLPPDLCLVSKTVLITGATSEVGLEAARQLWRLGANVIIGARNITKAEDVKQELLQSQNAEDSHSAKVVPDMGNHGCNFHDNVTN